MRNDKSVVEQEVFGEDDPDRAPPGRDAGDAPAGDTGTLSHINDTERDAENEGDAETGRDAGDAPAGDTGTLSRVNDTERDAEPPSHGTSR